MPPPVRPEPAPVRARRSPPAQIRRQRSRQLWSELPLQPPPPWLYRAHERARNAPSGPGLWLSADRFRPLRPSPGPASIPQAPAQPRYLHLVEADLLEVVANSALAVEIGEHVVHALFGTSDVLEDILGI